MKKVLALVLALGAVGHGAPVPQQSWGHKIVVAAATNAGDGKKGGS